MALIAFGATKPLHIEKTYIMLHLIGSLVLAVAAAVIAIPVCALCSSFGFTGVAALTGAGIVLSIVSGS